MPAQWCDRQGCSAIAAALDGCGVPLQHAKNMHDAVQQDARIGNRRCGIAVSGLRQLRYVRN